MTKSRIMTKMVNNEIPTSGAELGPQSRLSRWHLLSQAWWKRKNNTGGI